MTVTLFGGGDYGDSVREAFGSSLVAGWAQGEGSGSIIADISGNGRTGTYVSVNLAQMSFPLGGIMAPQYDGIMGYGNVYSASLATALATWSEGTALVFAKMSSAGVWSDAAVRRLVWIGDAADTYSIAITKNSTANQLRVTRTAGGATTAVNFSTATPTEWFCIAITWSQSNNRFRAWYSTTGVAPAQAGTTQTGVNAWSGITIGANKCTLGAYNVASLAQFHDGYEAFALLGNTELDFTTKLTSLMRIP